MSKLAPEKLQGLAYSGVGIQFAASVGILAWLGHLADGWLGTDPWLLVAGVFLGLITATCELLRLIRKIEASRDRES